MKRFIVIRHGAYDGTSGRLNEYGREQMAHLAGLLKAHLDGPTRLLSSTAPRALDSADALVKDLGLDGFESHLALWSDAGHPPDNDRALALVREKADGVDTLLVVTHLEYAEDLPIHFGRAVLQARIVREELNKGEAHVVLCDEKTSLLLR